MENDPIISRALEYIAAEKDELFRKQVEDLIQQKDIKELRDRFYTDLVFGTGGLRGIIGGGYNRMNPFVVQRATQGFANYMKKTGTAKSPSIVIAYDSRNFSDLFAMEASKVMCGNGIKTYLYSGLRSTPQLSFSVRHLKATAGIVITASHNPAEYNGYKVYWEDGGQIVPPHDTGIINEVNSVTDVVAIGKEEALQKGLLVIIDKDLDDTYIEMVKGKTLRKNLIKERGRDLKVVYTPLYGAGSVPVSRALSEMGINVVFVPQQKDPDGNFPTVKYPNPEEVEAMQMALDLAAKEKAHLVMGTDPDADRLGVAVADNGDYRLLTGNQLGALLAEYIFSTRKEQGTLPKKSAFVKTIVTTGLQRRIAESYGAVCYDTLTGFKYIAEKIREFEAGPEGIEYVFGGEESYGYLVGTDVRDKDAISAAAITAEMALYHLSKGRTLVDALNDIFKKYGYFTEVLISKYFKGESGLQTMRSLMARLRSEPPRKMGRESVLTVRDYLDGTVIDVSAGRKTGTIRLPSSNVLQFVLSEGSIVTVRPSGTEPKIKFYASCCSSPEGDLAKATAAVHERINAISSELNDILKG